MPGKKQLQISLVAILTSLAIIFSFDYYSGHNLQKSFEDPLSTGDSQVAYFEVSSVLGTEDEDTGVSIDLESEGLTLTSDTTQVIEGPIEISYTDTNVSSFVVTAENSVGTAGALVVSDASRGEGKEEVFKVSRGGDIENEGSLYIEDDAIFDDDILVEEFIKLSSNEDVSDIILGGDFGRLYVSNKGKTLYFENSVGTAFRISEDYFDRSDGSSPFVYLSNINDKFGIGTLTPTAKLNVVGNIDDQQLILQANSTQTVDIMQWKNSAGTVLGGIDERGVLFSDLGLSTSNIFVGRDAGNVDASGSFENNAFGASALEDLTTGAYRNNAFGYRTLANVTSGNNNTAFGASALGYIDTEHNNSAFGVYTLESLTTGGDNTAIGFSTGYDMVSGVGNTLVGYYAAVGTDEGGYTGTDYNTIIGYEAGYNLDDNMDKNIYIGYQAGYNAVGSNKLYMDNSNSATPLIYGEFDNDILVVNGTLGIGNTAPTDIVHIGGDVIRVDTAKTPATSSETCDVGEISWDTGYIYVCTATDTWKRATLNTF